MMRWLVLPLLLTTSCGPSAISSESIVMETMRTDVADARRSQHTAETEIEILVARLNKQEEALGQVVQAIRASVDSRLAAVEERQSKMIGDMKQLVATGSATRKDLDGLHKQMVANVKSLQGAMQSIVSAASGGGYKVKSGDSLGKIAMENNTTVCQIKERNNLKNDSIYPGQELQLP